MEWDNITKVAYKTIKTKVAYKTIKHKTSCVQWQLKTKVIVHNESRQKRSLGKFRKLWENGAAVKQY